jgi:hypothetical protein
VANAQEEARLLLKLLEFKGFTVPLALRGCVASCTDREQIQVWGERLPTAQTLEDVFCGVGLSQAVFSR